MQIYFDNRNKVKRSKMSLKAAYHVQEMRKLYSGEIDDSITRTVTYRDKVYTSSEQDKSVTETKAVFILKDNDTVSEVFEQGEQEVGKKIMVLNFASFKNPGGGFITGAMAQEEALCHDSTLYNVISKFTSYYIYNNKNLNKGLYKNAALYSPDILFFKEDKRIKADVLTCAAPNKSPHYRYKSFTEEDNKEALKSRIDFIRDIVVDQKPNTVILGAFGCGVFRQNPDEVAKLFVESFRNIEVSEVQKVVFAIPGNTTNNYKSFESVLKHLQ